MALAFMDDIAGKMRIPDWEFRVVIGTTKIDYDLDKEYSNREKHGYSLASAVSLLERIVFPFGESLPSMTSDGFMEGGEVRHMHMSVDDSYNVVLMVTTMRDDESVRIISFRRASEEEREQFYQNTGFRERV
jgi:uncharacterized DUF497 family protein